MTIYPARHIYNIQLTENVFQRKKNLSKFSSAVATNSGQGVGSLLSYEFFGIFSGKSHGFDSGGTAFAS